MYTLLFVHCAFYSSHINHFYTADNAVPLPNFGGGIGPIHMDEVCCKGNENSLFECPRLTIHDCDHDQDAGIRCEGMHNIIGQCYPDFFCYVHS